MLRAEVAERLSLHERRWARSTVVLAVGVLALSACTQHAAGGANYKPSDYPTFGQLDCTANPQGRLSQQIDFSDREVRTFVFDSNGRNLRLKIFGPQSSVMATLQDSGEVDIDKGTPTIEKPVVIKDMLPNVTVTIAQDKTKAQTLDVTAVCAK